MKIEDSNWNEVLNVTLTYIWDSALFEQVLVQYRG